MRPRVSTRTRSHATATSSTTPAAGQHQDPLARHRDVFDDVGGEQDDPVLGEARKQVAEADPFPGIEADGGLVDRVSRWAVAMAASRATAASAKRFLDRLIEQAPFPIKAIQVDGGSEFMADFEQACADRSIQLCVLPPRSPKLNGRVERLQDTFRHEFYASYPLPHRIEPLNRCIQDFNHHYNHQRPHQALGGLTPWQYLQPTAA
jgi:hypothetical protein